jgi:hypothetical protein
MAVIDIITYHNESDLFDLRYNVLEPFVDEFIVVESASTFGGLPKELNFPKIKDKYKKVTYWVNPDEYTEEEAEQARISPNTGGVPRWMHEFLQKESIQKAITHLQDEDMVFIGDVDEIWDVRALENYEKLRKLKLRVYTYYLNLLSSEEFHGPIQAKYKDIKGQCLNHLRTGNPEKNTTEYYGWHFTNQGGLDAVKQKVYDQYNPDVFGDQTYHNLEARFGQIDYIGRRFNFEVNESDWPPWLKEHRQHYQHMLK